MQQAGDRLRRAPSVWLRDACRAFPILGCFLAVALVLTILWALGLQLNGDSDDLLKLHEVRFLLDTGRVFDRTLPGILQPEPYVSHWPWIVDLPYAAFAWLVKPVLGVEAALSVASFAVPLMLLAPTLFLYKRLIGAAGFLHPPAALPLAVCLAMRGFFEFAPDRIDYHNLQILLLLAALALIFSPSRRAAFVNGLLAALALAISLEFAVLYAIVFGVYAWDFIFARQGGDKHLTSFGIALALAAVALLVVIVPPSAYGVARCDTYSIPYMLGLVCAGLSFSVVPFLSRRAGGWPARAAILLVLAMVSVGVLALLFPQCGGGPYGALSEYVRTNQLGRIDQEKSLFHLPDFVLSGNAVSMMILFVGALAPVVIGIFTRGRDRSLTVFALFSLVALVQAILYFRYFRYVPFFAGIGLLFVLDAWLPQTVRLKSWLANRQPLAAMPRSMLVIPGLALAAAIVLLHLLVKTPESAIPAAELAGSCDLGQFKDRYDWPNDARVLSPPDIGIRLLTLTPSLTVVAIPNHPASKGIERAYRFLDPQTPDPRAMLDTAQATHVALCAWRGERSPQLEERYPLAGALMEGMPPPWLTECPTDTASSLRIYSYGSAACPTPAASEAGASNGQATAISIR